MKNTIGIKMIWAIVCLYTGIHWLGESHDLIRKLNWHYKPLCNRGLITTGYMMWKTVEAYLNLFGAAFCLAVAIVYIVDFTTYHYKTKKAS